MSLSKDGDDIFDNDLELGSLNFLSFEYCNRPIIDFSVHIYWASAPF